MGRRKLDSTAAASCDAAEGEATTPAGSGDVEESEAGTRRSGRARKPNMRYSGDFITDFKTSLAEQETATMPPPTQTPNIGQQEKTKRSRSKKSLGSEASVERELKEASEEPETQAVLGEKKRGRPRKQPQAQQAEAPVKKRKTEGEGVKKPKPSKVQKEEVKDELSLSSSSSSSPSSSPIRNRPQNWSSDDDLPILASSKQHTDKEKEHRDRDAGASVKMQEENVMEVDEKKEKLRKEKEQEQEKQSPAPEPQNSRPKRHRVVISFDDEDWVPEKKPVSKKPKDKGKEKEATEDRDATQSSAPTEPSTSTASSNVASTTAAPSQIVAHVKEKKRHSVSSSSHVASPQMRPKLPSSASVSSSRPIINPPPNRAPITQMWAEKYKELKQSTQQQQQQQQTRSSAGSEGAPLSAATLAEQSPANSISEGEKKVATPGQVKKRPSLTPSASNSGAIAAAAVGAQQQSSSTDNLLDVIIDKQTQLISDETKRQREQELIELKKKNAAIYGNQAPSTSTSSSAFLPSAQQQRRPSVTAAAPSRSSVNHTVAVAASSGLAALVNVPPPPPPPPKLKPAAITTAATSIPPPPPKKPQQKIGESAARPSASQSSTVPPPPPPRKPQLPASTVEAIVSSTSSAPVIKSAGERPLPPPPPPKKPKDKETASVVSTTTTDAAASEKHAPISVPPPPPPKKPSQSQETQQMSVGHDVTPPIEKMESREKNEMPVSADAAAVAVANEAGKAERRTRVSRWDIMVPKQVFTELISQSPLTTMPTPQIAPTISANYATSVSQTSVPTAALTETVQSTAQPPLVEPTPLQSQQTPSVQDTLTQAPPTVITNSIQFTDLLPPPALPKITIPEGVKELVQKIMADKPKLEEKIRTEQQKREQEEKDKAEAAQKARMLAQLCYRQRQAAKKKKDSAEENDAQSKAEEPQEELYGPDPPPQPPTFDLLDEVPLPATITNTDRRISIRERLRQMQDKEGRDEEEEYDPLASSLVESAVSEAVNFADSSVLSAYVPSAVDTTQQGKAIDHDEDDALSDEEENDDDNVLDEGMEEGEEADEDEQYEQEGDEDESEEDEEEEQEANDQEALATINRQFVEEDENQQGKENEAELVDPTRLDPLELLSKAKDVLTKWTAEEENSRESELAQPTVGPYTQVLLNEKEAEESAVAAKAEEEKSLPEFHGEPVPEDDDEYLYQMAAGIKPTKKRKEVVIEEEDAPSAENIEPDYYLADLHIKGATGKPWLVEPDNSDGLALMWGGVRSNFGVKAPIASEPEQEIVPEKEHIDGEDVEMSDVNETKPSLMPKKHKVAFQIKIVEKLSLKHLPFEEVDPYDVRVGFSTWEATTILGEDTYSYCYTATGKKASDNIFLDYGEPFDEGDIITCVMDLSSGEIYFYKNDTRLDMAFRHRFSDDEPELVFPHLCTKNCKIAVNYGDFPEGEDSWLVPLDKDWLFYNQLDRRQLMRSKMPPSDKSKCTLLMMVGLPGVGKTTWVRQYLRDHEDEHWIHICAENIMQAMRINGKSRRTVKGVRWDMILGLVGKSLNRLVQLAARRRHNYILDMSNTSREARKRRLQYFDGFQKKCLVLMPSEEDMKERQARQARADGMPIIPAEAMLEMKAILSLPSTDEEPIDWVHFIEPEVERLNEVIAMVAQFNNEGRPWYQRKYRKKWRAHRSSVIGGGAQVVPVSEGGNHHRHQGRYFQKAHNNANAETKLLPLSRQSSSYPNLHVNITDLDTGHNPMMSSTSGYSRSSTDSNTTPQHTPGLGAIGQGHQTHTQASSSFPNLSRFSAAPFLPTNTTSVSSESGAQMHQPPPQLPSPSGGLSAVPGVVAPPPLPPTFPPVDFTRPPPPMAHSPTVNNAYRPSSTSRFAPATTSLPPMSVPPPGFIASIPPPISPATAGAGLPSPLPPLTTILNHPPPPVPPSFTSAPPPLPAASSVTINGFSFPPPPISSGPSPLLMTMPPPQSSISTAVVTTSTHQH